jgi:2-C-methyl-D-erythritol 2,4-cyclodiphosphate synthase
MIVKTGLGQDSHKFNREAKKKELTIGGIKIAGALPLLGNSDADVVLHAITNAFSSISGTPVLGALADELCLQQGITDSKIYLKAALEPLQDYTVSHIAVSIEASTPKMLKYILKMRASIAKIVGIGIDEVGITATSGEGLTEFGKAQGIQALAVVTVWKKSS